MASALLLKPRAQLTCICPDQASGSAGGRFWTTGTSQACHHHRHQGRLGWEGRQLWSRAVTWSTCAPCVRGLAGGTGLPCLLGDPHVATGRTDVWELRLERFPSLGSHRPCRDAGELGGDVAALGGLPSDPQKPRCAYTEREPCGPRAPGGKSSLTGTAMTGWGRGADHTCASSSPWGPGRPQ